MAEVRREIREVAEYYDRYSDKHRLDGISLEKLRTQELISRLIFRKLSAPLHLGESPQPGDATQLDESAERAKPAMRILDAGGGAGVYSFWLAGLGHEVHLLDLSPRHVEEAREEERASGVKLASIRVGDARELPFPEGFFDLVLLLGPIYHLTERADRLTALKEAWRVLKPGGVVAAAAISRYASMLDGFHSGLVDDPDYTPIMTRDLTDGQHRSPERKPYFTTAFFHLPDELEAEMGGAGFRLLGTYAVESFAAWLPGLGEKLVRPEYRELLLGTIRRVEHDRPLFGVSPHLLAFGRKG